MNTCDLVDQYSNEIQVAETIGLRHFGGNKEFFGKVQTLKCYEDNSLLKNILSSAGNGMVLVVDGIGSMRCALLGDVIASLAIQNGWSGVIINGCIRDSIALEQLSFGVIALGANPKKSAKLNQGEIGVPISFAGVVFLPGGYVYADQDGIVVAKRSLIP